METSPSCPRIIFKNGDSLRKSPLLDCVGMLLCRNGVMSETVVVNDKTSGDEQLDGHPET